MEATAQDSSLFLSSVQETGRELRRSAYGIDYAVLWHGTTCSAKKLNPLLFEAAPDMRRKVCGGLVNECRTWSQLRHPRVVQFLGLWRSVASPVPLIVTENMDTTVSLLLGAKTREQFPLEEKVSILQQVASGLAYLHSHSPPIIHGDLTSGSVMVSVSSMQAKITNFGIAAAVQPALSNSHMLTPNRVYLPLDVLESKRPTPITTEMDTFAYGVLVIHTITHTLPIPSSRDTRERSGPLSKVCELKCRQQFIDLFSEEESRLLLATVSLCLDFQPDRHLDASYLERQMREVVEECCQAQTGVSAAIEQGCPFPVEDTQSERFHMRLSAVDYDVKSKELQINTLLRRVERLEETVCSCNPNKGPALGTASITNRKTEDTACINETLGNTARFERHELLHRIWEIETMSFSETSLKGLQEAERELDSACDFIEPKVSVNLAPTASRGSRNSRPRMCSLQ